MIQLNEWWYEPDIKNPTGVYVDITVKEQGRFSGNINGLGTNFEGVDMIVIQSMDFEQRRVTAGENFTLLIPMQPLQKGDTLKDLSIALYLFKYYSEDTGDIMPKIYAIKL